MRLALSFVLITIVTAGCANSNSIFRKIDLSNGNSVLIDVRQRAILVAPRESTVETPLEEAPRAPVATQQGSTEQSTITAATTSPLTRHTTRIQVCAEPSPDAMASFAYELAAKASAKGADAELAGAMQDSAAFVGLRTQSIQLLRDFGYRLCESHMSGAITSEQYDLLMRRFQKNTVALLAIEQLTGAIKAPPIVLTSQGTAEVTKSILAMREQREKLSDKISELEREKAKAGADVDTAALTEKIKTLTDDRTFIDDTIARDKGALASGRTDMRIETASSPSQPSDQRIQSVAKVVADIVNNIVLSDDTTQVCLIAMQREDDGHQSNATNNASSSKRLRDWCFNEMDARTRHYAAELGVQNSEPASTIPPERPPQPAEGVRFYVK